MRRQIFKSRSLIFPAVVLLSAAVLCPQMAAGQLPPLPGEENANTSQDDALPVGPNRPFDFDESSMVFEQSADTEQKREEARDEAFDAALQGLLPLRPEEIRALLERFDRTQESVETPVYPNPKPEVVVQNISLDPGAAPATIKLAYGNVSTVNFLDITGAPWPVQDISWAGNFEVIEVSEDAEGFTHMFRISPQSEFAFGNISITLTGLRTPVIITLETNREVVHYRFDAVVPQRGPLAAPPLIESGITTTAGSLELSSILEGMAPGGTERLDVTGTDGRTSAYKHNDTVYLRTPLTLLSPAWSSSTSSADGTHVYEIQNASVVLLSDKGRMVRVKLSERVDILEDILDE